MHSRNSFGASLAAACLVFVLLAQSSSAAVLYWDPEASTTATTNNLTGTWNTTSSQWSTTSALSASPSVWVTGDAACFCAGSTAVSGQFAVTVGSTISIGGIYNGALNPPGYNVVINATGSGNLAIGATSAFDTGGSDGDPTVINCPLTGATGSAVVEGGAQLYLNATNTYGAGTILGFSGNSFTSIVNFNNSASFGTGSITMSNGSGCALVAEGSSAITIPNNFVMQQVGLMNIVGNAAGVTFSGSWTLPAGGTGLGSGGTGNLVILSGPIGGSGGFFKYNSSTMMLTGTNTYTGGTSNAGVLIIGGSGSLGSGTYATKMTNSGTFIYDSSVNQTLSGIMSGAGILVQEGSGILSMNAVETYTGGTSNGGTLTIGGAGTITAAGNITNNGTFNYSSSATETISGIMSGSGALNVTSGTLGLSGNNAYSGITTVSGGTLSIAASNNIGTVPASFVANQITLSGGTLGLTATACDIGTNQGITVSANSTISPSAAQSPSIESSISGAGILTKANTSGNLNLNASNSWSGGLTILGGGVRFNNPYAAGTGPITVSIPVGGTNVVTLRMMEGSPTASEAPLFNVALTNSVILNANNGTDIDLASSNGQSLTLAGNISGVGYLTRDRGTSGNGIVVLSGSNSFSGGVLWKGSVLGLGSSNALGAGALLIEPSNTDPLTLIAAAPLTGANAITNMVQIAVSNATEEITFGGSTNIELAGPVILAQTGSLAPIFTNTNSAGVIISGPISAGVPGTGFTYVGLTGATLTLNGTDTYNGATTISSGTLALGAFGSINTTPMISIAAGATFDVSANPAFTLSSSTALTASGDAPATIVGASGGTVNLGSQPIILSYGGVNPALTISQGTLILNGNAFTINGPLLAVGTYTIIQQTSGSVSSTGTFSVAGTAIRPGTVASISVAGGSVLLTISLETPAFSGLSNPSITYRTPTVTLSGTVSATTPATLYASNGETVTVSINGQPQTTTINDSTGDFTIAYNCAGLIYSTVPYAITYTYGGDLVLNPATNTGTGLTITPPAAPGVTNNPAAQAACAGSPATFTVGASGTNNSYAWYKHANAGWGSAWSSSGGGGTFLASSTGNDQGNSDCNSFSTFGDINTPSGNSWGIYGGGSGESVTRDFPVALTNGQVFQVDMDNGGVANGVQNGFALQNSSGGFLFSFYFQGGGSDYAFYDANGATTTSVGYTVTGLRIQVIVGEGSPAAYSLLITPCGGSTVEYSGTFAGTNGPAQVVLFNNNPYGGGDNDMYFNSMFAGLAYDSADDYSGGWSGQDAGDAAPISGATNASFVTSSGNNGDLYYAVAYNGAGYAVSTPAQLTVNPLPTVSVNSGTICAGDSEMLTATTSAANPSYLWSPGGSTNASITVSPASTTTYTVSVTDGTTGCMNGGSGTVTVNPLPMVSVNSAVVCAGDVATLTATTSSTNASYLWSPGGSTNASIMVSPSSTTMYTVTVTDQTTGCMNSGSGTVTVNPLPMVSVNSPVICAGATATLTATTSASNPSYLWSPGGATSASIMVSPSATANYMVTVTDGTTGCMNSGSGTVTVNPLPAIVLGASPTVAYGSTNASLTYGSPTGSPDQYSIIYDSTALAAGFTNVPATVLPASPITLVIPVDVGTNVFNGILVVDDSATGCGSTNYAFTITVSALPVQLTGTRPYDGTKDANASILTIINDLDGTNLTLAGSGLLAGSGVGLEPIADFTGLSLGGSAATNYTLAGASGSVTVSTVPLTITADAQTNTYGSTLILGNSAFMVGSGLVGTEMVTGVTLTANGGTAANSPVAGSPYTITPSAATGINGFLAANYAINYVTNSLTVNPLVVVLTGTRPYDGTATAASGVLSVSNAVGGDDVDLASGSATLAGSAVGLEPITSIGSLMLGGTTAPDYTLAGATGAVTVTNPHLPYSFIAASFDNVGTNIVMVWTSVPGVVYQVLGSGSASAPLNTWTNVGSPITATSTLTTNIVNASSAAAYFDITSH